MRATIISASITWVSLNIMMNCDMGSVGTTLGSSSVSCNHPICPVSETSCTHTESTLSCGRMRMSETATWVSYWKNSVSVTRSDMCSSGCWLISSSESLWTMKLYPMP